jgi:hypothetical protein
MGNAQTNLTLHDSLSAAIEKQSNILHRKIQNIDSENDDFAWLNAAPSISLSYLGSQQSLGTTEREISLNLPIKSPLLRQLEKTLSSKVESLRNSAHQQYALYLSGLIRNLVWEMQIEKISAKTVARKQTILSTLASQYRDMAQVQAIPQYVSLMVQKEFNDHKILSLQHQQNINKLLSRYRRLTGLNSLPDNIYETALNSNQININSHPDLLALDAAFLTTEQGLLSTSKETAPWNVQLTGRRVETAGFSENQLGIGIEVPINIGSQLSSIQQTEYKKVSDEYSITRSKLVQQLLDVQADLNQEFEFLQRKQILLNAGMSALGALSAAMNELREANTPNQEFFLRTLLNIVDSELAIEINQIYIQRHIALIRQAAGITL